MSVTNISSLWFFLYVYVSKVSLFLFSLFLSSASNRRKDNCHPYLSSQCWSRGSEGQGTLCHILKTGNFTLFECYHDNLIFLFLTLLFVIVSQDQLNMSPSTDFYKKMALECSAQQITVDLFIVTPNFADLTTVG